jgi:cell division protein FtsW (lipid II flippase)
MAKSTKSKQKKGQKAPVKTRGTLLTIALVVIVLHGLAAAVFYAAARQDALSTAYVSRPWLIALMSLHFLLNVVAAVGIWFWKKWAIYIYAASTILAVVVGLLSIGIWSIFYMVLPFVILGWLLRTKWDYFK